MVCISHIASIDLSFLINLDGFHLLATVHGEAINMKVKVFLQKCSLLSTYLGGIELGHSLSLFTPFGYIFKQKPKVSTLH